MPLDLSPVQLATLASAWPDTGVGVALTAGAVQIIASPLYMPSDGREGGGRDLPGPAHGWAYRVTMRLLERQQPRGDARVAPSDAEATWPPLPAGGEDEVFFPAVPPEMGALSAVTLIRRRWVMRGPGGDVIDAVEGPGVLGLQPRLVAGRRAFSYSSRTAQGAPRRRGGIMGRLGGFDNSILPGAEMGTMEGGFEFQGELVNGGTVSFWARVPVLRLRVPVFRF